MPGATRPNARHVPPRRQSYRRSAATPRRLTAVQRTQRAESVQRVAQPSNIRNERPKPRSNAPATSECRTRQRYRARNVTKISNASVAQQTFTNNAARRHAAEGRKSQQNTQSRKRQTYTRYSNGTRRQATRQNAKSNKTSQQTQCCFNAVKMSLTHAHENKRPQRPQKRHHQRPERRISPLASGVAAGHIVCRFAARSHEGSVASSNN